MVKFDKAGCAAMLVFAIFAAFFVAVEIGRGIAWLRWAFQ